MFIFCHSLYDRLIISVSQQAFSTKPTKRFRNFLTLNQAPPAPFPAPPAPPAPPIVAPPAL